MFSSTRQGCPLSPLIFAVAMDILLRRATRLFPQHLIRTYGDDLAMLIPEPLRHLSAVIKRMMDFALCSGLARNICKTVIIPLWESDLRSLSQGLAQALPDWAAVQLDFKAK